MLSYMIACLMGKAEKLFSKVNNSPQDVRFGEVCKLAEFFGFEYKGGKGSHKVYKSI